MLISGRFRFNSGEWASVLSEAPNKELFTKAMLTRGKVYRGFWASKGQVQGKDPLGWNAPRDGIMWPLTKDRIREVVDKENFDGSYSLLVYPEIEPEFNEYGEVTP